MHFNLKRYGMTTVDKMILHADKSSEREWFKLVV